MGTLTYLGRTLADSTDRTWSLSVHGTVIGASAASKFALPGSVETYVRQILKPQTFLGNEITENGHRREPYLLTWAGAERNTQFIHAVGNTRFAATPDGVISTRDGMRLAQTTAKHNRIVTGPTPAEIRQMAWQLMCVPEADGVDFVWGEYVREPDSVWVLRRDPETIRFDRDHPSITRATALIVPIAHEVIAALDSARLTAKGLSF
ncbi:hypothetical protein [Microbacterium gorillae]|uniref:hypothetical protein n=1 Tax=Microbacterium gorillae TaxID=1231063 RepID=UPI003D9A07D1